MLVTLRFLELASLNRHGPFAAFRFWCGRWYASWCSHTPTWRRARSPGNSIGWTRYGSTLTPNLGSVTVDVPLSIRYYLLLLYSKYQIPLLSLSTPSPWECVVMRVAIMNWRTCVRECNVLLVPPTDDSVGTVYLILVPSAFTTTFQYNVGSPNGYCRYWPSPRGVGEKKRRNGRTYTPKIQSVSFIIYLFFLLTKRHRIWRF